LVPERVEQPADDVDYSELSDNEVLNHVLSGHLKDHQLEKN